MQAPAGGGRSGTLPREGAFELGLEGWERVARLRSAGGRESHSGRVSAADQIHGRDVHRASSFWLWQI